MAIRTPDIKSSNTMRLTDDKVNKLAHTIADTLAEIDEVDFLEDRNTIRQEARKALTKLLLEEVKIDAAARKKIASQQRIIPEGSQEWDILYRKYYNDEVRSWGSKFGRQICYTCRVATDISVRSVALWCNWLTRRPLKAKSPGSSPGNATNLLSITYMVFRESQLAPLFRVRDAVGTLALKLGQFLAGL